MKGSTALKRTHRDASRNISVSNVLEYRRLILEGCFDLFFPALTDPATFQDRPWNFIIILRRIHENDDLASPGRMLCRTFPRWLFHSSIPVRLLGGVKAKRPRPSSMSALWRSARALMHGKTLHATPLFDGGELFLVNLLRSFVRPFGRDRCGEFLEPWITPKRIEHWIKPE